MSVVVRLVRLLRVLAGAIVLLLPWPLRRPLLVVFCGYEIDPSARIGCSWVFPQRLQMGPGARIGHLTVCKGLSRVCLGEAATIGNLNWVTGFPPGAGPHFAADAGRRPELIVARHAAITNRHLIDCTNRVTIGAFSTLAGFRTQVLTHSIDLEHSRQRSAPVEIGEYCFVGTGCVLLPGSRIPARCVVGALSLVRDRFDAECTLYGGVPAVAVRSIPESHRYFHRDVGYVT